MWTKTLFAALILSIAGFLAFCPIAKAQQNIPELPEGMESGVMRTPQYGPLAFMIAAKCGETAMVEGVEMVVDSHWAVNYDPTGATTEDEIAVLEGMVLTEIEAVIGVFQGDLSGEAFVAIMRQLNPEWEKFAMNWVFQCGGKGTPVAEQGALSAGIGLD